VNNMKLIDPQILKSIALSRSIIYDLLSACFIYPYRISDYERLVKSRIPRARDAAKYLSNLYPTMDLLMKFLDVAEGINNYDLLTPIEVDFTKVDYGAIPYEGYTHTGYLDMNVEISLRKLYADYDLALNKEFRDLRGDHIAVEFAFMSFLAYKEYEDSADALKYIEEEDYFISNHLLNWIPTFVASALKLVKTDYFKLLLNFTRDFITRDRDVIGFVRDAYANPGGG